MSALSLTKFQNTNGVNQIIMNPYSTNKYQNQNQYQHHYQYQHNINIKNEKYPNPNSNYSSFDYYHYSKDSLQNTGNFYNYFTNVNHPSKSSELFYADPIDNFNGNSSRRNNVDYFDTLSNGYSISSQSQSPSPFSTAVSSRCSTASSISPAPSFPPHSPLNIQSFPAFSQSHFHAGANNNNNNNNNNDANNNNCCSKEMEMRKCNERDSGYNFIEFERVMHEGMNDQDPTEKDAYEDEDKRIRVKNSHRQLILDEETSRGKYLNNNNNIIINNHYQTPSTCGYEWLAESTTSKNTNTNHMSVQVAAGVGVSVDVGRINNDCHLSEKKSTTGSESDGTTIPNPTRVRPMKIKGKVSKFTKTATASSSSSLKTSLSSSTSLKILTNNQPQPTSNLTATTKQNTRVNDNDSESELTVATKNQNEIDSSSPVKNGTKTRNKTKTNQDNFNSTLNSNSNATLKLNQSPTKKGKKRGGRTANPLLKKKRRIDANTRERQRMYTLNAAFTRLRAVLPSCQSRQLSKFECLHMAQSYISALAELMH